jgi:hypothetical protein
MEKNLPEVTHSLKKKSNNKNSKFMINLMIWVWKNKRWIVLLLIVIQDHLFRAVFKHLLWWLTKLIFHHPNTNLANLNRLFPQWPLHRFPITITNLLRHIFHLYNSPNKLHINQFLNHQFQPQQVLMDPYQLHHHMADPRERMPNSTRELQTPKRRHSMPSVSLNLTMQPMLSNFYRKQLINWNHTRTYSDWL